MELLDTRQLRAFQELARQGSFTAAAKNLNLTQSAVSHSIKSLETIVGVALFERLGKTVHLTPQGEILLPHVERIFSRMLCALEEISAFSQPGHGRLRIGSTVTLSQYVLPSVLREIRECFPAFEIMVTTEDTRQLLDHLGDGEIDLVIGLETAAHTRLRFQPLFQDHIVMALAAAHPLAQKQQIEPSDLAEQQYIFYNQNSETYRLLKSYFAALNVDLKVALHMGSMAAIKEMAKIGMGVGLIAPWMAERELRLGELVVRELPATAPTRRWGIYSDPQHVGSFVEGVFTGICRTVLENLQARTGALVLGGADAGCSETS